MKKNKQKKTNCKLNDKEIAKVSGGVKVSKSDSRIDQKMQPIIVASSTLNPDMVLKGYGKKVSPGRCVVVENKVAKK